jgi:predicted O-methyltransferase YrrM
MYKDIQEYVDAHTDDADAVLQDLERQTNLQFLNPRMCSGYFQGQLLQMLSKMIKPKYILEIGTFSGYSAICLAKGLEDDGKLFTLDINDEIETFVMNYVKQSGLEEKVELKTGNALDIIPTLDYDFDIVFIDADKENYINYYEICVDKIKSGAYILVDNVLWDGKVIEPLKKGDVQTEIILKFNQLVKEDERVETIMLPIRDGLTILRKK